MGVDKQSRGAKDAVQSLLLVEDNDDDARLAIRALEGCGVRLDVARARDGHEALCMLGLEPGSQSTQQPPDLVICDVKMPRVGGIEVLALVRSDERLRDVPIVMLSTSAQPSDVDRAMELGACDYCVKPFDAEEYAVCVREIVKRWLSPAGLDVTPPCLLETAAEA